MSAECHGGDNPPHNLPMAGHPTGAQAAVRISHLRKLSRLAGRRAWPLVVGLLLLSVSRGMAQTSTRLLVASGETVPDHPGFVFGPFSGLVMNARQQIAFLTTLESARLETPAIVRSVGVTFSVVAFRGLVAPAAGTVFESFGAPSMNDNGTIAFSAALNGAAPSSGIFSVTQGKPAAVALAGQSAPGAGAPFQAFSSPVIGSSGAILFGALTGSGSASPGASGLYLWTPQGLQSVPLPAGFTLGPGEMLQPIFQNEDESVWIPNDVSVAAADDQLFRALAIRSFQSLTPPPNPVSTALALAPLPQEKPVPMLLVILHGTQPQTMALEGDPTQPVMARLGAGAPPVLPLIGVESAVAGALGGRVVIASAAASNPGDLAFYCYCNGAVERLTTSADMAPVAIQPGTRAIHFLTGDGSHTLAFTAPLAGQANTSAIFVTSLP